MLTTGNLKVKKIQAQAEKDKADEMVESITLTLIALQQMKTDYAAKSKAAGSKAAELNAEIEKL